MLSVSIGLFLVALIALAIWRLRVATVQRDALRIAHQKLIERFKGIVDVDAERERVLGELRREADEQRASSDHEKVIQLQEIENLKARHATTAADIAGLNSHLEALRRDLASLDEEATLQSFGFYKPHYDFADAARYQTELERIRDAQKLMLKQNTAAGCGIEWTVNGSKTEGRRQIKQTLNLMLRAFNGECDAAIAKVKYNNVNVMEARIRKAHEKINSLAAVQRCTIAQSYLDLKLQELYLAHEYQEKVHEERDEQRRIREQMREEEIAQRELEKARIEAEEDEKRYSKALSKAREEVERAAGERQEKLRAEIADLQRRLDEARANKERAIARAQLTRSGHVYIISNIGSFGEDIFKIGMTRRLDPHDRVRELSGAAVPFDYDVHAMIYSDDAPSLENALHKAFHLRRVNRVNERREFFRVNLDEIIRSTGVSADSIQVARIAEAVEYRKTLALIDEEHRRNGLMASAPERILPDSNAAGKQPATNAIPSMALPTPSASERGDASLGPAAHPTPPGITLTKPEPLSPNLLDSHDALANRRVLDR